MATTWSVMVEADAGEVIDIDKAEAITLALDGYGLSPAISVLGPRLEAQVSYDALDAAAACHSVIRVVENAMQVAGYQGAVIAVKCMTWEAYERSLGEDDTALVGVTEAAAMLGTSKQRLVQLAEHADFPKPLVTLANGRVWQAGAVQRYARQHGRKRATKAAVAAPVGGGM